MPEFHLDTSGYVAHVPSDPHQNPDLLSWRDLDSFTQGYVEALFFTDTAHGYTTEAILADEALRQEMSDRAGELPEDCAFGDLAPEALEAILRDCAAFQESRAWADTLEGYQGADEEHAGRDFWYTRNGHGCGFWDGDWPEPYATALTEAAEAFRQVDVYLGDDGKVYLS